MSWRLQLSFTHHDKKIRNGLNLVHLTVFVPHKVTIMEKSKLSLSPTSYGSSTTSNLSSTIINGCCNSNNNNEECMLCNNNSMIPHTIQSTR